MHKKKVLFMINSMYGGGAEKIFQTLLNNLEPSKYDITVYSVNQCNMQPEKIVFNAMCNLMCNMAACAVCS